MVRLNGANGKSLRQVAENVTDPLTQIEPYIEEAYAIMNREAAIGVAAPQLGVPYRWYITPGFGLVANPVLTDLENKFSIVEGCLSLPERWFEVERYKTVTINYQEIDLTAVTKILTEYEAFVAQHEVDHLDGILIQDHGTRKYAGE